MSSFPSWCWGRLWAVWPDWAIYWTLGNFLKDLATINLPKSPTFLGNFCKGVKIYHFYATFIDIWQFFSGHTGCDSNFFLNSIKSSPGRCNAELFILYIATWAIKILPLLSWACTHLGRWSCWSRLRPWCWVQTPSRSYPLESSSLHLQT